MSDEAPYYVGIGRAFASHGTVTHNKNEYVRGTIHTNTIEGSFGLLQRGIKGCLSPHRQGPPQPPLREFSFRYSHRHARTGRGPTCW